MSVVRTATICAFLLALAFIMVLVGCEPDRTGAPNDNAVPQVFIVNTPPDSAQFSRNPELSWYATDIDGYIDFFRYAVIVDSMLTIGGVPVTPEQFIAQAADADYDWDTLFVTLDLPQSSATIQLYADTLDPVNTYISQYFFVQAQDDRGAKSDIVYRLYSRNNHPPNTHHRASALFINAINANSAANGINVTWDGADSTDWGRTDPPLDFEWRLYGPFELDDDIYVNMVQENCIFNPTTGTYSCTEVPVLNTDAIPDTIQLNVGTEADPIWVPKAQPLATSQGPNYANDPTDTWISSTQATIYNVFANMNITRTSQYKFVFWVRARDDGFVPDPTPAFSQFSVIEAKFERDIALIDDNQFYINMAALWMPFDLDTIKSVFYDFIHNAGYTQFDTAQDVFWSTTIKNRARYPIQIQSKRVRTIDILSHKILVYYTDTQMSGIFEPPPQDATMGQVYFGLDQGATAWVISRNITSRENGVKAEERGVPLPMSGNFLRYFGVASVSPEAWTYWVRNTTDPERNWLQHPWFREEFVGAYSANPSYPNIDLDYGDSTSLLDIRYGQWTLNPPPYTPRSLQGMPEVGYCNKVQYASALYLYFSKFEDDSEFHGKVCAVRAAANDTRTACFLFTPLAMDPEPMQEAFTLTLDWLMEKFSSASGHSTVEASYNATYGNLAERKQSSQEYLDYISEFTTPEEKEALGIALKPFVVQPQ